VGFADIVAKSQPAVVRIMTSRASTTTDPLPTGASANSANGARSQRISGEGSGVIISSDGYILTNHHVIDGSRKITVYLDDEREFAARLIASDAEIDLAVLKVETADLPVLSFGDSSKVRPGDYALAIGNPFGIGTTVTLGIVSAKARQATNDRGPEDLIQTDAAINPGNSGGPLVDMNGDCIGINTAIVTPSGASSGVGFAIPANLAREVMTDLVTRGRVKHGYLGVGMQPLTEPLADAMGIGRSNGAIIADVYPESPAARAGIRKGDVVTALNGRAIRDFSRLRFYVASARPGDTIRAGVLRMGREEIIEIHLTERPTSTTQSASAMEAVDVLPGATVSSITDSIRRELQIAVDLNGVAVLAVDPAGVSAEAGLRPGDVIVFVNHKAAADVTALQKAFAETSAANALLEVSRNGSTYFVAVRRP
jgi:serine protease Do